MAKLTRAEVIEIRDVVRDLHGSGVPYSEIADIMGFECGVSEAVAYQMDFIQSDDSGELDGLIETLAAAEPQALKDYLGGKKSAIGALIGIVKKASGSPLDAKAIQKAIVARFG